MTNMVTWLRSTAEHVCYWQTCAKHLELI